MMVRFATTCDVVPAVPARDCGAPCGMRSLEYTAWPSCRECGAHVCPMHAAPGTLQEDRDFDGSRTVVCVACTDEPS